MQRLAALRATALALIALSNASAATQTGEWSRAGRTVTVETREGGEVILIRYVSQPSDRNRAALAESCVRQRKDSYKAVSCVAYGSEELLRYRQGDGERPCWQVWAYSEHHKVTVHPDNAALNLLPPCGGWVQLP